MTEEKKKKIKNETKTSLLTFYKLVHRFIGSWRSWFSAPCLCDSSSPLRLVGECFGSQSAERSPQAAEAEVEAEVEVCSSTLTSSRRCVQILHGAAGSELPV